LHRSIPQRKINAPSVVRRADAITDGEITIGERLVNDAPPGDRIIALVARKCPPSHLATATLAEWTGRHCSDR
jgi:hypothetical protein